MNRFAKFAVLLLLPVLGTGCAKSTVLLIETQALCRDWTVYKPAKGDKLTDESAEQLLESNLAREVWGCSKHENEAAT